MEAVAAFGGRVTAPSSPGLMGSETTVGCCCLVEAAFAVDHRWPVPFCPSRGRSVMIMGG